MIGSQGVPAGDLGRAASDFLRKYELRPPSWKPWPHQVPPTGDWYGWLLLAGRGSGKTDASANYVNAHVMGPPCLTGPTPHWVGIIAPTLGDAVTACYAGPSGIRAHNPDVTLRQSAGGTVLRWPNGSEAKLFGASSPEDVERLRAGGNRCLYWLEELAAWRYLQTCWEQVRFGLRTGPRPHWVASTTPKPRPLIKKLAKETPANVVVTTATTDDNPSLQASVREALFDEYGGADIGRQELYAELLEESRDALWKRQTLSDYRIDPDDLPKLNRVTVGVDPSGGVGEQGIIVAGRAVLSLPDQRTGRVRPVSEGYVLADRSCALSPHGWGRRAIQAAIDFEADDIVVERNFGGAMATGVLVDAAEYMGITIPIREVVASRGKRVRAEPVAALAERGRHHMVGIFGDLEDQLCTWTPESDVSPDRLDAMVWTAWHTKLVSTSARGQGSYAGSELASTRIG